ncbi:MAG: ubiquinone/menaquinone biosynthesis methyltransferase [Acidimicrobiales bacterium]
MSLSSPLPEPTEKERFVHEMFDAIAPTYDLVNRLMTFGIDQRWRARTLDALALTPGASVLDLACGTGDFVRLAYKRGHFVIGVDFARQMLVHSSDAAPRVQASALSLPFADASFDAITCGFALRNFASIPEVYEEAARILKPGGAFAVLEVSTPRSKILRTGHQWYFNRVVPQIGRVINAPAAYRYLPASVAYLPSPHELARIAAGAGFAILTQLPMFSGAAQLSLAVMPQPTREAGSR